MRISTRIEIDATADHVWEIIGPGFAHVGDWASAIPASRPMTGHGPGGAPCAGRVCDVAAPGVDEIVEELTEYDAEERRLSYRATRGMPGLVSAATNTWQARPGPGRGTTFTMDGDVRLRGAARLVAPFLRLYLSAVGRRTCHELKSYVETGSARD